MWNRRQWQLRVGALAMMAGSAGRWAVAAQTTQPTLASPAPASGAGGAGKPVAQLIGANLISPLTHRGYPLAHNLPAFLNPGPDGAAPKKVWAPVDGTGGDTKRWEFAQILTRELCYSFSLAVSQYRRTTHDGFNFFLWNGVRMNGLKIVSTFEPRYVDEARARRIWRSAYNSFGGESQPDLQLAPSADGYPGLFAALDYLRETPGKAMWLASADAPNAPKDEQPNEAALVLVLAQPGFDSGRRPLAHFYAPVQLNLDELPAAQRAKGKNAALAMVYQAAIEQAAAQAGLQAAEIGTWVRDTGKGTAEAAQQLAAFSDALYELKAEPSDLSNPSQNIDMASLLGKLGANSANFSLLMASYAAHAYNHPVMIVSTSDTRSVRAIVVMPPPGHRVPEPKKFRYAASLEEFNRPWWGERLDGKLDI